MAHTILAIDVGSTRLKAALYAGNGAVLSHCNTDSPLAVTPASADSVFDAVLTAADIACANVRPAAIVITGATRTHVLTAGDGVALGEVVKLDDARGAPFEDKLREAYGDEPHARGMGAYHPLARLLECKTWHPARYEATRWQLELKDWLNFRLTGTVTTDRVAHDRFTPRHRSLQDVLRGLGLRPDLCPAPMPPGRIVGPLRSNHFDARLARWQGIPVIQCGFDAWCASYGMDCVHDNHAYNVSGTTEVFGRFCADDPALAGIDRLRWAPDLFHLGGPCLTGLSTLAWFGRTFLNNSDPQSVLDCAAQASDDCPLCLPFVSGERMPFWRADLSAQFLEVRSHHGLPEFARALIEGLMAFQRHLVAMLCPDAKAVYLGGGACALRGWPELKASMFAMPVARCRVAEPSLLGAAMSALTGIGCYDSIAQAQTALAPTALTVLPDMEVARRIEGVEQRLRPYFKQFARS